MTKKNMTVDDLAVIIKKEFENTQKEFENIKKEFINTNKKIDNNSRKIDEIKMKMAYVSWQIDMEEVKSRLSKVEKKIGFK